MCILHILPAIYVPILIYMCVLFHSIDAMLCDWCMYVHSMGMYWFPKYNVMCVVFLHTMLYIVFTYSLSFIISYFLFLVRRENGRCLTFFFFVCYVENLIHANVPIPVSERIHAVAYCVPIQPNITAQKNINRSTFYGKW